MTYEEITATLQRVADNQAKHDELHERHEADIADLRRENEKRFAELAESNRRAGERVERLEGSYELLESFVREFRNESRDYFTQTDIKLATLAGIQVTTNEVLAAFIKETNARFAEVAQAQARTDAQIRLLINRNGSK